MKSKQLTQNLSAKLLGLSLTVLSALAADAQTWQTVLDYQLVAGKSAGGEAIVADAVGNVFSGGDATDAAGTNHTIVLKTDTTQANWYLSDDTNPDYTQYQSALWNLGLDAGGNVYSIGQLTPYNTGTTYWYVRKSSDSGATWSTVDQSLYGAGQFMDATGFAADDTGNVYVVGWGQDQTVVGSGKHTTTQTTIHWLVRKSTDGGKTWRLVDDVIGPSAFHAGFVPGAGIFVVGGPYIIPGSWMVRQRPNGEPGTWSTVDGPFT